MGRAEASFPERTITHRPVVRIVKGEPRLPLETSAKVLKVGTVAQRLGVSASLVRSLGELGLANPSRNQSKYRLYSIDDLRILRRAIYLRRAQGLNAPAIVNQLKQEGLLNHRPGTAEEELSPLGPQFRRLRLQRGVPLSTVASAVGVSKGFLSNLERSRIRASTSITQKLTQYYGLCIPELFNAIDGVAGPLVRPRDRRCLENRRGIRMELLAPGKIMMEPQLFRVAPGACSGESYSHEGEEFLYLVRGRLIIVLAEQAFRLRAGDSFYFTSKTQHRWVNPGKTETIILWINAPPSF